MEGLLGLLFWTADGENDQTVKSDRFDYSDGSCNVIREFSMLPARAEADDFPKRKHRFPSQVIHFHVSSI